MLTDRERFSIFEGPVFHRDRVAAAPRRSARHDASHAAAHVLDARPAGAHAVAPGPARSVPAACGDAPSRPTVRAVRGGALDVLAETGRLRRPPRLRVAGGRPGGGAAAGVPRRGRRAARGLGERVRGSASPTCRDQRGGPGCARRAATTTSSTSSPSGAPPVDDGPRRPHRRALRLRRSRTARSTTPRSRSSSRRCSSAAPRRCRRPSRAARTSSGGDPSSGSRSWPTPRS